MKKNLFIFCLFVLLSACHTPSKEKEDIGLPKEQIVDLMIDVQLMESIFATHREIKGPIEQAQLFQEVLKKHQISQSKFDSIRTFLENNLNYYKVILDSMAVKIEKMDTLALPLLQYTDTTKKIKLDGRKFRKD